MTDNSGQFIQYPQQWVPQPPQAPQPGVLPLRPADVSSLLGGSFKAVFRNWQAAILVPFVAYLVAIGILIGPAITMFAHFPALDPQGRVAPNDLWSFFSSWLIFMALTLVVLAAVTMVVQSVVTVVVSRAVLGRTTSIGQALRGAAPRMLSLLGLNVLVWLIVAACVFVPFALIVLAAVAANSPGVALLAFLLFLAGGVAASYFWISFSLAPSALILEPAPVLTSLRRSRWLVTGGWWRVFGILLLCQLLVSIANYLIELPVSLLQFGQIPGTMTGATTDPAAMFEALFSPVVLIVYGLLSAVLYAVGQPFMVGVTTLLYHDLRIRKESFHLPLWEMSQLPDELSPQQPATPPSPEATI